MTMEYVIISDPTCIFSASITVTATVGNIGLKKLWYENSLREIVFTKVVVKEGRILNRIWTEDCVVHVSVQVKVWLCCCCAERKSSILVFTSSLAVMTYDMISNIQNVLVKFTRQKRNTESSSFQPNQQLFSVLITVDWFSVVDCSGAIITLGQGVVFKLYQVKIILFGLCWDSKYTDSQEK